MTKTSKQKRIRIAKLVRDAINEDGPANAGNAFEIEQIARSCADEIGGREGVRLAVQCDDVSAEVWEVNGDPKAPLVRVVVETGVAS